MIKKLFLAANLFLITLGGCTKFVPIVNKPEQDRLISEIVKYNNEVKQIKALANIRAYGLLGYFIHEQADLLIQAPKSFLLSIRSPNLFPLTIFASNEKYLTMQDYSGNYEKPYKKILIEKQNYLVLYGNKFYLDVLLYSLQAKIPIEDSHNLELSTKNKILKVMGKIKNNIAFEAQFDLDNKQTLNIAFKNKSGKIFYQVCFYDYTNINGIKFPKRHVVKINGSRRAKLEINFENLVINDKPLPKEFFFLSP